MLKKTIGIGIAIALALIIGIVISGGIRITKANTRVATLPAHESRVVLVHERGHFDQRHHNTRALHHDQHNHNHELLVHVS